MSSIDVYRKFPDKIVDRLRKYRLEDTYRAVGWAYACINAIAESCSSVPLLFYKDSPTGSPSTRTLLPKSHPIYKVFNPPKQWEVPSCSELVKRSFINLGNVGEAFLLVEKKGSEPENVTLIPSSRVEPKYAADGVTLIGWKLKTPTGQDTGKVLKVGDIIPLTYYNPYEPYRGLSPLAAGRLAIEQEINMSIWNAGFFLGGVRNPLVIILKRMFASSKQRMQYLDDVRKMYSGFASGQGPMLVEGGSDVRPLFQSMKDLDFISGKKLTREEICGLFGVPPAQVGIFEYANYANSREQRRLFWDNTCSPKLSYFRDMLQSGFVDIYYPGIVCDFDWKYIERKNEDPIAKATNGNLIASASLTLSSQGYDKRQIAVILDKPELDPDFNPPDEDSDMEGTSEDDEEDVDEIEEGFRFRLVNPPQVKQLGDGKKIETTEKFTEQYGANFANLLLPGLASNWNHFVSNFAKEVFDARKKGADLDADHWKRTWERSVSTTVRQIFEVGIGRAMSEIDDPDKALPSFKSIVRVNSFEKITSENPQDAINWFSRETAAKSAQIFGFFDSLFTTEGPIGLVKAAPEALIMTQMTIADAVWAASRIYHHARFMAHCARGVTHHKWVYSEKCGVRSHASLAGKTVGMWQPFADGGYIYPHSHDKTPGSAPCYCTTYPVEMT